MGLFKLLAGLLPKPFLTFDPLIGGSLLLTGALGGYGASEGWFGGEGEEAQINPYGNLNPEQIALTHQYGPYLQNMLGAGGFPQYQGQMMAPFGSEEMANINRANAIYNQAFPNMGRLAQGLLPTEDYFQTGIYKPALREFTQDVLPLIEEASAGPGGTGFYGSNRARNVQRAGSQFADTMAGARSGLSLEAMRLAPTALDALNRGFLAQGQISAAPRLWEQLGLEKKYAEFVRTRPESGPGLQAITSFLGLDTGTYIPAKPSMWEQLFPELIKGGAQVATAAMMSGGG